MIPYNFEIVDSTFKANGANTMQATVQRQKPNQQEECGLPLATTIFPDQSKVANKANRIPLVALFIIGNC
jgi:hypothetical protein